MKIELIDLLDGPLGHDELLARSTRCSCPPPSCEARRVRGCVSSFNGDVSRARPVRDQPFHDLRVDQRASLRDRADGSDQLVELVHALLQDVGAPGAAGVQQCKCVARVRVLAEDDHAEPGFVSRNRLAAWIPSSELPGGMRTSVTTTSGSSRSTASSSESRSPQTAATSNAGLRIEQSPDAFADEIVILGEHEADRHGRRIRR